MKKISAWLLVLLLAFSTLFSSVPAQAAAKNKKVKLNVKKLNMTVDGTFTLRVYNVKKKQKVTFTSSNEAVVSLTGNENSDRRVTLTAASIGSSTITATVKKGRKTVRQLKCRVKVSPSAVSIKFTRRKVRIALNEQYQLEPIIKPSTSTEQPIYESSNSAVATVSCLGVVTGVNYGSATISATLPSTGMKVTCTIDVINRVPKNMSSEQQQKRSISSSLDSEVLLTTTKHFSHKKEKDLTQTDE